MSARPRNNAIPIGDGHWIDFIVLEGRYNEAVEIDPLLIDLLPLWQGLEQHCEAACCGFDAFNFHPDAIASATRGMNTSDLNRWLSNAIRGIEALETTVVVSRRLNNLADKRTFLALLSHIQACIPPTR
jgi:hypothetical protein